ncbi:Uncharacterised protein [Bordetella pertussis]|nr:Uncharacterised protein [Bordetella pertussis]CFW44563.1 Uncharacterised protein [Bordetella pertussis]
MSRNGERAGAKPGGRSISEHFQGFAARIAPGVVKSRTYHPKSRNCYIPHGFSHD